MLRVLARIVSFVFPCAPDVANLLLDLPDGLKVGRAVEGVPAHEKELDQISRDVSPGDVKSPREVRERKAVVYGHDVRHTIPRIDHDAGRQAYIMSVLLHSNASSKRIMGGWWKDKKKKRTLRIEREHGLNGDVHPLKSVLLEHDLTHPLPVRLGVHRWLGEQHLAPPRVDTELLRERVIPQVLHVLPIPHDPVLHRLRDLQVVPQRRRLVAHHDVLDDRVPDALLRPQDRSSYHGWEHCIFGGVCYYQRLIVLFFVERREISSLDKGIVLTVLGKVGASISDFDELYECNISVASTLIFIW